MNTFLETQPKTAKNRRGPARRR